MEGVTLQRHGRTASGALGNGGVRLAMPDCVVGVGNPPGLHAPCWALEVIQTYKPIIWTENVAYYESGDTAFLSIVDQLGYQSASG